jgi:uncharacterized membrane protein YbhN (UPF0104 family)
VTVLLLGIAAWFLTRLFHQVDPGKVRVGLASIPKERLAYAALAAVSGYALIGGYDFMSLRHLGERRSYPWTLARAFVVYSFTFNFGSLVGALAMRYRLYSKAGLKPDMIVKITACSTVVAWTGYSVVSGVLLTTAPFAPPPAIGPFGGWLRLFGVIGLGLLAGYLWLCAGADRSVRTGKWTLSFPSLKGAACHIALASAQWLLVGSLLYAVFPPDAGIAYAEVMTVYVIAAAAGLVIHVPAGFGVLEGIFVGWLGERIPRETILTSIIAFRAIYYLIPLAFAAGTLGVLELRAATRARRVA